MRPDPTIGRLGDGLPVGYTAGMRTVILLLAIVAIYWILRHYWRRVSRGSGVPPVTTPRTAQALVRCAHCGVHVPADQAVRRAEQTYCSPEHARIGHDAPHADGD